MSQTIAPQDDPPPSPTPDLDRAVSPVAGRLSAGRSGRAVVLGALLVGCAVFVLATWGAEKSGAPEPPRDPVRQLVRFEPAPTLAAPGPDAPRLSPDLAPTPEVPALSAASSVAPASRPGGAKAAAPLIAYSRQGAIAAPAAPSTIFPNDRAEHELDALRRPSTIGRAQARRLGDRNYLVLAGSALPCVLQTAMDSGTPGYVACLIPRDVMSDNGAVVLMEKGTRVLGEYRSGLRQGQRRLFVLWTRAVTPAGVAVDFASPASDGLGRAGFDGQVDTRFWDRFSGAVLLTIVDGAAAALADAGSGDDVVRLPSDAAGIAAQGSGQIAPTLRKPQGAEVAILVTQDLDFSSVYGLAVRPQ